MNFYLTKLHSLNCSRTALKESNDIMYGDAKPLAFIQETEEIVIFCCWFFFLFFFQWCEYFFMAVKIISRMQHGKIYLAVLNWIFTLHYRKVKAEETGTHERFRTTKELVRFFSFVVMSGKRLAWATCLGLAEMQLFCGQLFKLQKYKNQGGTSQSLAFALDT